MSIKFYTMVDYYNIDNDIGQMVVRDYTDKSLHYFNKIEMK